LRLSLLYSSFLFLDFLLGYAFLEFVLEYFEDGGQILHCGKSLVSLNVLRDGTKETLIIVLHLGAVKEVVLDLIEDLNH
jgi:hypothetical protein